MATEIRALREDELEAHAALVHASYYEYVVSGERNFLADPHWWLKSSLADPYYRPDQTRVMLIDGQMVASVTNYTRQVNVDGRLAKVSCIGSVCTHPDFRKRGLVRQVLVESIDWMEREGYDWSFLFGKQEVYGGNGWTILSSWNLTADLLLETGLDEGLSQRAADPERDLPALASLYDAFNARLTGPIVRSEDYWRTRVFPKRFHETPPYHLIEASGKPIAYWAGGDGRITEVAWIDQPREVLALILRQWPEREVTFPLATSELIAALREISRPVAFGEQVKAPTGVQLSETYKGLWRYIGPARGQFPEITDTDSLKRFMRDHEYCFWPEDGF
jgi:GNAT superfamily N-acetyltransferase